jgi:hypothetical protein
MNDKHIRVMRSKVRKTQHQNPEFGHTQGDVKVMDSSLLKIGLQLCVLVLMQSTKSKPNVVCDLGG